MIARHRLAPFLRIELGGECGRAYEVAEQHCEVSSLAGQATGA
jgi:hypothetical protein